MRDYETHFFMAPGLGRDRSGHRLAYHEWGASGNSRVLFCVHGLTRNAMDFAVLAARLSPEWRVIAVDLPGRGKSDWLGDADRCEHDRCLDQHEDDRGGHEQQVVEVADLAALLDHLAIDRVDWLGTSMGGIIGMMMAGLAPDRVRRLVLNDVGAWIPAQGLRRIRSYAGKRVQFASRTEAEEALRAICAPFGIREEAHWQLLFASSLVEAQDGSIRMTYDPAIGATLATSPELNDIDLWPVWKAVHCPTLILRGEESDILTRETAETMCSQRPGVTLVEFPGIGHAPSLMEPDQIVPVEHWLSRT